MKSFLILLFTSFTLLVSNLNVLAQDQDYVIITRGDKQLCKIRFPVFNVDGEYVTDKLNEPAQRLDPYEINEYYIAKTHSLYRAVYEPQSKALKFMFVIESGTINLYEYTTGSYSP